MKSSTKHYCKQRDKTDGCKQRAKFSAYTWKPLFFLWFVLLNKTQTNKQTHKTTTIFAIWDEFHNFLKLTQWQHNREMSKRFPYVSRLEHFHFSQSQHFVANHLCCQLRWKQEWMDAVFTLGGWKKWIKRGGSLQIVPGITSQTHCGTASSRPVVLRGLFSQMAAWNKSIKSEKRCSYFVQLAFRNCLSKKKNTKKQDSRKCKCGRTN